MPGDASLAQKTAAAEEAAERRGHHLVQLDNKGLQPDRNR